MDADLTGWTLSVVAFAAATAASPGPNNAMVAASGATFGFRATVPHMLGVALGFPVMILAVAAGAGGVFRAAPWLHDVLRWIGAAYLLWLALRIARAEPVAADVRAGGGPLSFRQAALFQWVNPKAWVMGVGAVITYTGGAMVAAKAGALAVIFVVVALPSVAFWTLTGVGAARVLRTRRARRGFNLVMAGLLVVSLVPVLSGE